MSTTAEAAIPLPWGLVGQDGEVAALARGVAAGAAAHSYLISGPPASGKGTLALRLAQALNCTAPEPLGGDGDAPCGACRSCRQIAAGTHPDVTLVSPGGPCDVSEHDHRKDSARDIRICQVRALEHRVSLRPFEGRVRVEIVDPADALNAQSADAFLKTLEEPPPAVVLVLVTSREEALPETVRSRLRRVAVRPAPLAVLETLLQQRGAEPDAAALVARLAGGRAGWALDAVAKPAVLEERAATLDTIATLGEAGLAERFAHAAELAARWPRDRAGVAGVLGAWQLWWRDVALSAAGAERGILNVDRLNQIRAAAAGIGVAEAARFLQALRDAQGQLEENANPRLALEVLMLRLPERRTPGISGSPGH